MLEFIEDTFEAVMAGFFFAWEMLCFAGGIALFIAVLYFIGALIAKLISLF